MPICLQLLQEAHRALDQQEIDDEMETLRAKLRDMQNLQKVCTLQSLRPLLDSRIKTACDIPIWPAACFLHHEIARP